ncbi:RICIN domain-containing protein [Corallococcus llansteffanensis]|uniref:Alpha-glucosidase n=1 Tax=Corallococcus llansteffanensis TaxID=2316731 RepID=A0A3A8PBP9_9BACT|nr:RICIN domain-containing protein [Corallococcus llansteffanensis]RKH52740.1 alpha-glucosidase [Corallococcus llansteffanensis]
MRKSKLMKLIALSSVLFVGAILGLSSEAHAQWTPPPPLQTGPGVLYKIVNVNSGKVLDIAFNSKEASYRLHQWEYLGLPSQKWYLAGSEAGGYVVFNLNSGLVMEQTIPLYGDGAKIWQWWPNGTTQQNWRISNVMPTTIWNSLSGKVVDVEHNGTGNGAHIHQWQITPGVQSQLWRFERVN